MPMDHRGVSPDSSTHISEKSKKTKKRKHKQKKTSHKKHKSSAGESNHTHKKSKKHKKRTPKSLSPSDGSDEEIFDIKPLSGYVDDRKQLHKEIFTLVSKKEVKDLLPDSLKKLKFKEFKNLCHEQLEVMSQKRLRHIIAGQEMVSSSSDESIGAQETVQQHDGTNTGTAADENPVENKTKVDNLAKPVEETPTKTSILEEMSVSPNQEEIDELIEEPKVSQQPPVEPEQDDDMGQSISSVKTDDPPVMLAEAELKELEFRARALKSLVMARGRQQQEETQKE